MCKTTVVIPNYNGNKFLKNCLDSVTRSDVSASVIVVDNGSSDGSEQIAKQYGDQVKLICFSENRGFSAAVNAGIKAADTPYVFLLNNDVTVEPDCIRHLEQALEADSRLFSVGAKMLSMYEPEKVDSMGDLYSALGWGYAIGKDKDGSRYQKTVSVFSNCAGAALYRKQYLEETGLFDELHFAYLEDVDLGYRARILGYKNQVEPKAVIYHAGSGSSGSRYNSFKIPLSAQNNIYLIYKNMPFLQLILNLPLLLTGFAVKQLFFIKKGFGKEYAEGLYRGLKLCLGEGKHNRVPFAWKNLKNYCRIQLELWINLFRRF